MVNNPIPNNPVDGPLSGVTPPSSIPGYGGDTGPVGDKPGDTGKTFTMPDDKAQTAPAGKTERPSPMDVARQTTGIQRMSPEQMSAHLQGLQNQLSKIQGQLQDPKVTSKLTDDHITAMKQVINKMNPDLRTIANETGGKFQSSGVSEKQPGGVLQSVSHWINGSQEALGGALNYLSNSGGQQTVNPASYLKLQYSVQRATQRGELFASIISSTVSGIKTIMSTQLG